MSAVATERNVLRWRTVKFTTMGGPAEIRAWCVSDAPLTAAIQEIDRLDKKYSRYVSDSEISRINDRAGHGRTRIDPETATLLEYAESAWKASGGMFDVTSGVLSRACDFKRARMPTREAIECVLDQVGWQKVAFRHSSLELAAGMEIDLDGIVKEYAADRAVAVLRGQGVGHALVELAGDIATTGPLPDGSPWLIRIRHPRSTTEDAGVLELFEGGIATSGDYERCMIVNGRRYSHILDPRTGWPVEGLASATVRHGSCVVAGTLATIAMLKGREGEQWLKAQDVECVCILA